MSISVLVVDAAGRERGKAIAISFYLYGIDTYFYDGFRFAQLPEFDIHVSSPSSVSLVLLHDNDKILLGRLRCSSDMTIRYTGGSPPVHGHADELWVRERSITSADDAISKSEAREILQWLASDAQTGRNDQLPALLQPPKIIQLLPAIAILCQGYLAAHAEYDKDKKRWGPPEIENALRLMGWGDLNDSNKALPIANLKDKLETIISAQWWLEVFGLWDATKASPALDDEIWAKFEQKLKAEWQEDRYGSIDESLLYSNNSDNGVINALRNNLLLSSPSLIAELYCALVNRLTDKLHA